MVELKNSIASLTVSCRWTASKIATVCPSSTPRGVRMLRSLSAAAMARSDVAPAACSSATMGARSAARSVARAWRASTPARRAFAVSRAPPSPLVPGDSGQSRGPCSRTGVGEAGESQPLAHRVAVAPDLQAVAVVFDFVNPVRAGRRLGGTGWDEGRKGHGADVTALPIGGQGADGRCRGGARRRIFAVAGRCSYFAFQ